MNRDIKAAIARELGSSPDALTPETPLSSLEQWDSVTVLTLMVVLGDSLGKPVAPEAMAGLKTFGDIEKLVASMEG